jgi:hypothetical protein
MNVTNRVVEHLFKLDPSTGVPNLNNLYTLAGQRVDKIRELAKDPQARKLWSRTYASGKDLPSLGHILRLHIVRGVQVAISVITSLTVDGLLPEAYFVRWEGKIENQSWVLGLACLDLQDLMLSWVKESTAYLACCAFQQTETNLASLEKVLAVSREPLPYKAGILGPGPIRKACRFLMAPRVGHSPFVNRVMRLAENVLYVKRSCPPMLPHCVEQQLAGHRSRVCRVPAEIGMDNATVKIRALTKASIKSIVHRIFDKEVVRPIESFPSMSASYLRSRHEGGALGELLAGYTRRDEATSSSLGLPQLESMREVRPGKVLTMSALPADRERLEFFSRAVGTEARKWGAGDRKIYARPTAICEPCKVRVVTIAEAEPYQKVLPIQKWLWRKITEHRVFKYVGQPIGQEWAEELDLNGGPVAQLLRDGGRFVSGDFSAATDNLDPALTEYAWECICGCASVEDEHGVLPLSLSPFAGLVKKALTGHCLDYGGPVIMDQTWGQLMGSPVSFPLLNIINAATTAVSMFIYENPDCLLSLDSVFHTGYDWNERWESLLRRETWKLLKRYSVRTNGDDLFFICPADTLHGRPYEIWKQVVSLAGLQPSLGKNYVSDVFAVMNSEMRQVVRCEGPLNQGDTAYPRTWRYEAFVNLPLIMGMEAKGPNAGQSILDSLCWWEMAPREEKLLRGLDGTDSRFATRIAAFELWHGDVIRRVPPGVDYYVPQDLGGAGLRHYGGRPVPLGPRKRAAWLACLDEVSRLTATSFPAPPPTTLFEEVVRRSSKPNLRYVAVVKAESEQIDRSSRSYGSATFANVLREYSSLASIVQMAEAEPEAAAKLLKVCDLDYASFINGTKQTAPAMRLKRESRASQRIARQLRLSQKAGLTPMSQSNLDDWTSLYVLREEEYSPSCRVLAML